jgi:hypothetical protein
MANIFYDGSCSSGGSSSVINWGAAQTVTISSGAITVAVGKWYKVLPESGVTDNLDTINGLTEGGEVMLSTTAGNTIVLRDGVDNLDLGSGNITLNSATDRARLMHDGTNLVEASSRP